MSRSARSIVLVFASSLALVTACRAVPGDVIVSVRNLSPGAVTLTTEEPGAFILPETVTHQIKPWKKGVCYPRLGLYRGHIKLTVSGSNIPAAATYETTTSPSTYPPPQIGVQVNPDGHVEFGVSIPDDVLPCIGGGY